MIRAAFVGDPKQIERVYGGGRRARIEALAPTLPGVLDLANSAADDGELAAVRALFSTWGMPCLTADHLERLPSLEVLFYAAGDVRGFAQPLLARGVRVVSAWRANGVPVAEFAASQILLSCKGYFRNVRERRRSVRPSVGPGAYGETVALLGAGAIGSLVAERLRSSSLQVLAFDPFLEESRAQGLGLELVSLDDAFERGFVVSNHLLDCEDTRGMIQRRHLASMRAGATFVNTGRGQTVEPGALEAVLADRPDLTALLDVTDPEPLPEDSRLWQLENCIVSSHIAGSVGTEVLRMADLVIEEYGRFLRGETLLHAVDAI